MPSEGGKSNTLGLCVGPAFKTASNAITPSENQSVHDALESLALNCLQLISALGLKGGHPCVA